MSLAGSLAALPYLIGILFCYLIYCMFMRQKHGKDVEGKVWGEFFAKNGQSYGALCKVDRGCVWAPKGHEIGMYFIDQSCSYDFKYPPGKMRMQQVNVRRSVWLENNPVPKVSTNPAEWIESEDVVEITSFMIETAANEAFQKSALEMQKQFWSEITQIAQFVKKVPLLFYIGLGTLAASGAAAMFAYMAYGFIASRFP